MSMAAATMSTPLAHAALAQLEACAQRFDVAYLGSHVCWRSWGSGPSLVLIHGGHGSWMHWVRNIESLARHHTVWVPDLPGFGDSGDLAIDAHAADRIERLIDALVGTFGTLVHRTTPIDVAGFSFGGVVAAQFTVLRRQVRRLALLGPVGHGGLRRQRVAMVNWRRPDRAGMLQGLRHNLEAFMLHDPVAVDDLAMSVHEASCLRTRFRSKAISHSKRLQGLLARYEHPVLLIWGEHDVTAFPHEIAPELAEAGTGREWCVVPGGGHWVQYERADEVNQLLRSWFTQGDMQ
jgi:pimeloyl-ACP methyl ester carboxylesterase